jgi:hypothetical protein
MILRRASLALAAAALASAPAWAAAAARPGGVPGGPHGAPGIKGKGHRGDGEHGRSRRCTAHAVGYVASGTLESESLTKNADGTYSGALSVDVTHANHHAKGDLGKREYTLQDARVTFGLKDIDGDGVVGLGDLAAGDSVHLVGRITVLPRRCPAGEFTPTTTIRHVVFHAARPPRS